MHVTEVGMPPCHRGNHTCDCAENVTVHATAVLLSQCMSLRWMCHHARDFADIDTAHVSAVGTSS